MSATTRHTSTLGQANEAWALLKIKYPECPTGRHWPEVNIPPPPLLPFLQTRLNPPPLEQFARGLLLTLANRFNEC